jgi:hypothetical protein
MCAKQAACAWFYASFSEAFFVVFFTTPLSVMVAVFTIITYLQSAASCSRAV